MLPLVPPHLVWHLFGLFPTLVDPLSVFQVRNWQIQIRLEVTDSKSIYSLNRYRTLTCRILSLSDGYIWDTEILAHLSHIREILTVGHLFRFWIFFPSEIGNFPQNYNIFIFKFKV